MGGWCCNDVWVWSLLPVLQCKSLAHLRVRRQPSPPTLQVSKCHQTDGRETIAVLPRLTPPAEQPSLQELQSSCVTLGTRCLVADGTRQDPSLCWCVSSTKNPKWHQCLRNKEQRANKNICSVCCPLVICHPKLEWGLWVLLVEEGLGLGVLLEVWSGLAFITWGQQALKARMLHLLGCVYGLSVSGFSLFLKDRLL